MMEAIGRLQQCRTRLHPGATYLPDHPDDRHTPVMPVLLGGDIGSACSNAIPGQVETGKIFLEPVGVVG